MKKSCSVSGSLKSPTEKKKHKKSKKQNDNGFETAADLCSQKSKHSKKMKEIKCNENENGLKETVADKLGQNESKELHKKKKSKKALYKDDDSSHESLDAVNVIEPEPPLKKCKKKKHKKDKSDNDSTKSLDDTSHTSSPDIKHLTPKKKKHKEDKHKDDQGTGSVNDDTEIKNLKPKKKKKRKHSDIEEETTCDDINEIKHKKKKLTHDMHCSPESEINHPGHEKKKQKISWQLDVCEVNCDLKKGHKNKKEIETEAENPSSKTTQKHKKKKHKEKQRDLPENDKKIHREKKKKDFEISQNDQAHDDTNNGGSSTMGQWSTAEMGNDNRQNKFFRLLGGLKKEGLSNSTNMTPKSKFNMALNRNAQDKMDNVLETQFDQARELIITGSKGVGLGYEPPPDKGKKFYIDTNKSKSVKFD